MPYVIDTNFALRTCSLIKTAATALTRLYLDNGKRDGFRTRSINDTFNVLLILGLEETYKIVLQNLGPAQSVYDGLTDIMKFLIENPGATYLPPERFLQSPHAWEMIMQSQGDRPDENLGPNYPLSRQKVTERLAAAGKRLSALRAAEEAIREATSKLDEAAIGLEVALDVRPS